MAKKPEAAMDLMMKVWPKAVARVREEVADMQKIADSEGAGIEIEPWDYRYYAEKVRQAKYDLDSDEVKQYLQLANLIDAMHFVAGELFQFAFTPVTDGSVPVWHEDVTVWEVTNRNTGEHVGLWNGDAVLWMNQRPCRTSFRGYEQSVQVLAFSVEEFRR